MVWELGVVSGAVSQREGGPRALSGAAWREQGEDGCSPPSPEDVEASPPTCPPRDPPPGPMGQALTPPSGVPVPSATLTHTSRTEVGGLS